MGKTLFEMAANIIQAQVATRHMSPDEIQSSLLKTFSSLQKMKHAEETGEMLGETSLEERSPTAMDPRDSIQNDKIVCLECGAEFRQLTINHLKSHGMDPREYKKKYGFSLRTPLSAKALSKARSKAAKKRGLPENLVKLQEEARRKKMEELPGDVSVPEETIVSVESPAQEMEATKKTPAKRGRKKKTV